MLAVELQIAAIPHFEPLCRIRLRSWLKNLSAEKRERPDFIAVEWDREIFEKVKQQRVILHQIAKQEWPSAPQDFVNALSGAMGFEADTHEEVFPHVEVLWLEQGRSISNSSVITDYAYNRMAIYRSYLPKDASILNTEVLEAMSKKSWEIAADAAYQTIDRDLKFTSHILDALTYRQPMWAIAIVGASHASGAPDSMRTLLEKNDVLCKVTILNP